MWDVTRSRKCSVLNFGITPSDLPSPVHRTFPGTRSGLGEERCDGGGYLSPLGFWNRRSSSFSADLCSVVSASRKTAPLRLMRKDMGIFTPSESLKLP